MTLCLNNGASKRVTLRLHITDFLVKSILRVLSDILPSKVYENLYQDYLEVLTKSNVELQAGAKDNLVTADQLGKLSGLLLALFSGDHASLAFMGPQEKKQTPPAQAKASTTPTQTLQTKILRSSTTSFGADSAASRRKLTTTTSQGQGATFSQLA